MTAPSDPREAVAEAWAERDGFLRQFWLKQQNPRYDYHKVYQGWAGELLSFLSRRGWRVVREEAWRPIETAPRDQLIWVWAAPCDGLPGFVSHCHWHPDAGFCVDELREPTLWQPIVKPEGPK